MLCTQTNLKLAIGSVPNEVWLYFISQCWILLAKVSQVTKTSTFSLKRLMPILSIFSFIVWIQVSFFFSAYFSYIFIHSVNSSTFLLQFEFKYISFTLWIQIHFFYSANSNTFLLQCEFKYISFTVWIQIDFFYSLNSNCFFYSLNSSTFLLQCQLK